MSNLARASVVLLAVSLFGKCEDWSMYLHDLAHSSFNAAESVLNTGNAGTLTPAWKLSLGQPLASSPTIRNGVMYFGDWGGNFYAIRANDGAMLWKQFVGKSADPALPTCQASTGVSSQPVILDQTVYVGGGDAAMYALDATTGSIIWRKVLADTTTGAYLWSSIVPVGQSLYIGIASLADCPLAQGALVRIDLADVNHPAFRYLASADDPGSGIWSTPAIDLNTNTIYVTTGTGTQDAANGSWGSTFMSLNAATLATKAYYLLPSYEPDVDIEWGSSPALFQTPDGKRMAAATGKDGVLYVLNRDDLSLAWTLRLAVSCVAPELGCGSISTPATDGRLLYVGAGVVDPDGWDNGSVYAIDPVTRQVQWMRTLPGTVIPAVTLANGIVFVPTMSGALAFDAQTGNQLWSDGGLGIVYSQIVVLDGTAYITYFNGDVIAWRLPPGEQSDGQRHPRHAPFRP